MRSRTFLNVSLGVLALAAAYHFGAVSATAQAPGNPVVATFGNSAAVITANGDVYQGGLTSRKTQLSMTSRTLVSRLLATSRAGICWPPASR